jgi:hypothetical protein
MNTVTVFDDNSGRVLPLGTQVEMRNRFDGGWTGGFEVAEVVDGVMGHGQPGTSPPSLGRSEAWPELRARRCSSVSVVGLSGESILP